MTGSIKRVYSDIVSDGNGWVVLVVGLGWFLSLGTRYIYPSLLPLLRDEFGIGLAIAGSLLTALWVAYALGQFPGGVLGDWIGEGNVLIFSTVTSAFAIVIVALSVSWQMLFVGTLAFGMATAIYGPTRFTIFTDLYSKRAGTAVGITMAIGSIGNTVLPPLATVVGIYTTWRLGYGLLAPLFLVVAVGLWIAVPARTSSDTHSENELTSETMRRILSNIGRKSIPAIVLIQILLSFVSQGFLGFYPIYLVDVKGFPPEVAAVVFGLYFAVGVLVQPLVGIANDNIGSGRTLTIIVGLYFVGLLLVQFGQSIFHFVLLTTVLSVRNGTGVINNTYIAENVPDDIKGSGLGLLRTLWIFVGALSPLFVGYLGEFGHLNNAMLLLALLAGVTAVLSLKVRSM